MGFWIVTLTPSRFHKPLFPIVFKPDKTIFEETEYDYSVLEKRLREMAFLTKNLKIILRDLRPEDGPVEKTFHYEGGIREFVTYLNKSQTPLYEDVLYFEGKKDNVYVMSINEGIDMRVEFEKYDLDIKEIKDYNKYYKKLDECLKSNK